MFNWFKTKRPEEIVKKRIEEQYSQHPKDKEFLDSLDLSKCKFRRIVYPLINDNNREFVYSLNKRQAEYYFSNASLTPVRAITLLEDRVYGLEERIQILEKKKNNV